MFTGIVRSIGEVRETQSRGSGRRLVLGTGGLATRSWNVGDSIAVAGVCLTATEVRADGFSADLSPETLAMTTLGALGAGDRVNLEPALLAGAPLGGHFVSGHVDGVGRVEAVDALDAAIRMRISYPPALARYLARKGSVCVDGVSLTINRADAREIELMLVPHTLAVTTLGALRAGSRVNLEVDLLARYLEGLLHSHEHD